MFKSRIQRYLSRRTAEILLFEIEKLPELQQFTGNRLHNRGGDWFLKTDKWGNMEPLVDGESRIARDKIYQNNVWIIAPIPFRVYQHVSGITYQKSKSPPVIIHAVQFDGHNGDQLVELASMSSGFRVWEQDGKWFATTLENKITGVEIKRNDYLILGVENELYHNDQTDFETHNVLI
jgi:hypothetical protein